VVTDFLKISTVHLKFGEKIRIDQIQFFSTHILFKHCSKVRAGLGVQQLTRTTGLMEAFICIPHTVWDLKRKEPT
jgi:hypothetical protein